MKRFLNWLQRQKKETVVALTTLLIVVIAGAAVLFSASKLQGIFDPDKFTRFGNRQEGEAYDSVAGDGLQSDLADRDRDGNTNEDEEGQKAVKTEGINPQDLEKSGDDEGIGRTFGDSGTDGNTELNPDAYQITDNGDPQIGGAGSGTVGGNTGTGPGSVEEPGGEGEGGSKPGPKPNTDPDPALTLSTSEQEQLKPRDPIITADGELLALYAAANDDRVFGIGAAFDPDWVSVSAVFLKDGRQTTKTLSYGGADGYSVSFSTEKPGKRTAIFRYHGMTAAVPYEVPSSHASVNYHANDSSGAYAAAFPGTSGSLDGSMPLDALASAGDEAKLQEMGEMVYPSADSVIDLTMYHRWMIAYLGDRQIIDAFHASEITAYKSVTLLEEGEDGYLETMLVGFRYLTNKTLQGGSYLYYPVSEDWGTYSRSLVDVVGNVPAGYRIKRETTGDITDLPNYTGEQVLERYLGSEAVIDVPMGVTKIKFTEVTNRNNITEMRIPESVHAIDTASVAQYLPNLTAYAYPEKTTDPHGLKVVNGVLYSADGSTLLSVPPGLTEMPAWNSDVTAIAAGAFRGSRIQDLTIPESVVRFEEDCFAGFKEETNVTIHIESTVAPKLEAAAGTGFTGTILTPASEYDRVLKDWMFAFADENIKFGTETGTDPGETGTYRYDSEKQVIVYRDDPEKLAGIPTDTLGIGQVPEGITSVGAGAFAPCGRLYDIVLPKSVNKLEDNSLILPKSVESVTLQGEQVVEIGSHIFGDPGNRAPDIVVYVPEELYDQYLEKWKGILDSEYGPGTAEKILRPGSGSFLYENGAKYQTVSAGADTYRMLRLYDTSRTSFGVKEGTTEIAEGAFADLARLEIVYLPASVTKIGTGAFSGCTSLQTVTGGAKSLKLAARNLTAESGAADVRAYEPGGSYPDFLYGTSGEVYGRASGGAYTLLDVPTDHAGSLRLQANTVSLGGRAFLDCAQLTGINGAETTLTSIGDSCFENCTGLTTFSLANYAKLTGMRSYVFRSCTNLKELILPDALADTGVGMCYGCTKFTYFHAGGLKELGDEAFAYCSSIGNMENMEGITKIGDRAFMGCSSTTAMSLPASLKEMGEECFRDCTSLKTVELNGTMTAISRYAFAGCRDLATVKLSAQQKKSLRVIGVQAFANCSSLESVDFGECTSLQQMGAEVFSGCGYLTLVTLPASLKSLPDRCFADCGYLSILKLTSGTAPELGERVFGDAVSPYLQIFVGQSSLQAYIKTYEKLLDQTYGTGTAKRVLGVADPQKEVIRGVTYQITAEGRVITKVEPTVSGDLIILHDTVRIAREAFRNCTQLTAIELPDGSNVVLEDRCFTGCSGLKEVRLYGDIPQWGADTFRGCTAIEKIELGNDESDQIAKVGDGAFAGCTGLKEVGAVAFRAHISVLGASCFSGCSNMATPAVTDGFTLNLNQIGERAFAGCKSLGVFVNKNESYPALKSIGSYAFTDCDAMVQPVVPSGVTSIGEGCFAECDNLQYVSFYCGLAEYPKDLFKNCPKLMRTGGTTAALQSLKRIGEGAYEGCTSLTMPVSPAAADWHLGRYANLEEIGANAFRGCTTIRQLTVPATVKTIGANAFAGCTGITSIQFLSAAPPEIKTGALDGTDGLTQILVPDGDGVTEAYTAKLAGVLGAERMNSIKVTSVSSAGTQGLNPASETENGLPPQDDTSEIPEEDAKSEDGEAPGTEKEPETSGEQSGSGTDGEKATETGTDTGQPEADEAEEKT